MSRYFLTAFLFLALVSTSAFAADNSSGDNGAVHGGGLSCFSITPPKAGGRSCDALCENKGAACVSLKFDGAISPGFGCGDALNPLKGSSAVAGCRCCALDHH